MGWFLCWLDSVFCFYFLLFSGVKKKKKKRERERERDREVYTSAKSQF